MNEAAALPPAEVLARVAQALPEALRSQVIIVGSLAAGYHFFAGDGARAIRTKDVDCLFSPHATAVVTAAEVTHQLLSSDWTLREDARWGRPGQTEDATENLPLVRLRPPGAAPSPWFLELLSAPPEYQPGEPGRKLRRVSTRIGDFAICSFDFLALAEWQPLQTPHGVRVARPEMMALANLLHHPTITDKLIAGTDYKRANKDLGRVLALAYLTLARDRREGAEVLDTWASTMWQALQETFGDQAPALALRAGGGVRELLASAADFDQALRIANLGLLSSLDVGRDAFRAAGLRFVSEVVEALEERARAARDGRH